MRLLSAGEGQIVPFLSPPLPDWTDIIRHSPREDPVGTQWETRGKTQRYTLKTKTSPQKKVLSLVLCVAMLLSVMVMGTGAAFTDQDEIQNAEAVDMTSALGIIDGYEDGSFQPAENIERGEAAKMISAMLNGGRDSVQETTESSYNDVLGSVDAWANKYIEYCTARGIVSGVGGDRFAPASNVTGTQLAKMLLVSLGYDSVKEGYQDNAMWSVNVNTDAVAAGLYAGIETIDMSAPLSRDNAAQMIWNALQANTVYYLTDISDVTVTETTLLADVYGASITSGIMTEISNYNRDTGVYTYVIEPVDSSAQFTVANDAFTVESTVDYSDLFAMNVTVVRDGKDALNIWADADNVIAEAVCKDVDSFNVSNSTIVIDGTKYRVDNNPNSNNLKVCAFNEYWQDVVTRDQYAIRAIDTDNGGDIDTIVVYPYTVLKVTDVDTDDFTVRTLNTTDGKLVVDSDNSTKNVMPQWNEVTGTVNFDDVQVEGDLARYDYVMAIPARHTAEGLNTYIKLDVQSGVVSSLNTKDVMMTIDGTTYDGNLLENVKEFADISTGKTYNYVEVNDFLFMVDGAGIVEENYALVTDISVNTTGTTDKVWNTTVLLPDGDTQTVLTTAQQEVGSLYTYTVAANGYWNLTPVNDGSLNANTSVYDIQEAYETGANLSNATDGWPTYSDGTTERYGEDLSGDYFLSKNEAQNEKYYIDDDAAIYVYYVEDNRYDVITGAELAATDLASTGDVRWAFTGANEASNGYNYVELGYVAIGHDINEVTVNAYISDVTERTYREDGVLYYYADVTVLLPGEDASVVMTTQAFENENAQLIQDVYGLTVGQIYEITLLNDEIVHVNTDALDLVKATVTATDDTNGDKLGLDFTGSAPADGTYFITENTEIYDLDNVGVTGITVGDEVWVIVGTDNELTTLRFVD